MKKRAGERIPVNIEVRLHCGPRVYPGTLTNISESGMFISMSDICVPLEPDIEVCIPFRKRELKVSATLSRVVMRPDFSNGIGVEIENAGPDYMDFLGYCNPGFCPSKHPHL